MAKRGRPRTRPEPDPPQGMVYECTDRRGEVHLHKQSGELSAQEAMERLGVWQRPFRVRRYPVGQVKEARLVQDFEAD
jgi:hypothetical protein